MMISILAQTAEDLKNIATGTGYTTSGVLLVALAALGYVGWTILGWAKGAAEKVMNRGFEHLDKVDATMASLQTSISSIPKRLDDIESKVDGLGNRVDDLDRHITKDRVA